MLLERRLEMGKGKLRRLPGVDLRRFAQCVQCSTDCALRPLKSLSDAVGRGITEPALKALESLAYIVFERGLAEKLPQAVGSQQQPFDLVGGPNTEGSAAAGGVVPIVTEDAPSADRFFLQMHRVIASQKAVADQKSNLFAMGTRGCFQLVENRLDFPLGNDKSADTQFFAISPCGPQLRSIAATRPPHGHSLTNRRLQLEAGYDVHDQGGWLQSAGSKGRLLDVPNSRCNKQIELRPQSGKKPAQSAIRIRHVTGTTSSSVGE